MNRRWLGVLAVAALFASLLIFNLKNISAIKKTSSVSELLNLAKSFEEHANLKEARATYQKLINDFPNSNQVLNWQRKAEGLNIKLLFSPALAADSVAYEIKPGDTLTKIAEEFNTTIELIMKANNLSDTKIFPGRKLKVTKSVFSIVVDKSQNSLTLKAGEEVFKTYTVATGVNNSTPAGTFKITHKLINPTWFKAGAVIPADSPKNILGTRWLGFDLAGYGIHGTNDPSSLGTQVTQGCVRMSNPDVEELYAIVPSNTEVTIVD